LGSPELFLEPLSLALSPLRGARESEDPDAQRWKMRPGNIRRFSGFFLSVFIGVHLRLNHGKAFAYGSW